MHGGEALSWAGWPFRFPSESVCPSLPFFGATFVLSESHGGASFTGEKWIALPRFCAAAQQRGQTCLHPPEVFPTGNDVLSYWIIMHSALQFFSMMCSLTSARHHVRILPCLLILYCNRSLSADIVSAFTFVFFSTYGILRGFSVLMKE